MQALLSTDPAASRFREFCLGFNLRWLFFPDATVRVGSDVIVRDGKLQ